MSAEENKALAHRFLEEVFSKANLDAIDGLFDPDWDQHDPAMPEGLHGSKGARQLVEGYHGAFPDVHFTVEDQVAEADKVVIRWTALGTHQGELMGIPPSGNQVTVRGITIDRFSGGKMGQLRRIGYDAADRRHPLTRAVGQELTPPPATI